MEEILLILQYIKIKIEYIYIYIYIYKWSREIEKQIIFQINTGYYLELFTIFNLTILRFVFTSHSNLISS